MGRMGKRPLDDSDRKKSAIARAAIAKEHDGRIDLGIALAVLDGAKTLKSLVEILNRNGVAPRTAKVWTIPLVDHELSRTGNKVKDLYTYSTRAFGDEPLDWSEDAFWRVVTEQRKVAERNGRWVPAVNHAPKKRDVVRNAEHGEGYFHDTQGLTLLCRFRPGTGLFPLIGLMPVEVEVFVWDISAADREDIFGRITDRFLTKSALVRSRTITLEQRRARQRAIRWS